MVFKNWKGELPRSSLIEVVEWIHTHHHSAKVLLDACDPDVARHRHPIFQEARSGSDRLGVFRFPLRETPAELVLSLGGDGTILRLIYGFQFNQIPPIIAFSLGSLGFLAPFPFTHYQKVLDPVLHEGSFESLHTTPRIRLDCRIYNSCHEMVKRSLVFNEVLVSRGMHPALCKLNLSVNAHGLAQIQSDGLIIGTPSGSSAYNLAAGGALVHPQMSSLLITAIAPHNLTTRPLILPEDSVVELRVPMTTRLRPTCSLDGFENLELQAGYRVCVQMAPPDYQVPLVDSHTSTHDWLQAIRRKLNWGVELT